MTINELKFLRSLQQKKYRKEHRCFLVEGSKSVKEVLQSDFTVKQVYATKQYIEKHPDFLCETYFVTEKECERISSLFTPPSIFALVEMKFETLFSAKNYKKLLLLDGIKDNGNFGTIIRTADWFGIKCIVCSENTVELYNPKTIQASMGSFTRIDIHTTNLCEFIKTYENTYSFIGTFTNGIPISCYSFPEYSAVVLGNESFGISPEVSNLIQKSVSISRKKSALLPESLNVSASAAIICYELGKGVNCE
jgi:TrmH family RNA methyltransferase